MIDSDPEVGEDSKIVKGCGKFKVKMRILEHIPQYLPVNGRKVKIYYKGIAKLCTNCYDSGHLKHNCSNQRITWIDYVKSFMDTNPDVPALLYGRWLALLGAKSRMNHLALWFQLQLELKNQACLQGPLAEFPHKKEMIICSQNFCLGLYNKIDQARKWTMTMNMDIFIIQEAELTANNGH